MHLTWCEQNEHVRPGLTQILRFWIRYVARSSLSRGKFFFAHFFPQPFGCKVFCWCFLAVTSPPDSHINQKSPSVIVGGYYYIRCEFCEGGEFVSGLYTTSSGTLVNPQTDTFVIFVIPRRRKLFPLARTNVRLNVSTSLGNGRRNWNYIRCLP